MPCDRWIAPGHGRKGIAGCCVSPAKARTQVPTVRRTRIGPSPARGRQEQIDERFLGSHLLKICRFLPTSGVQSELWGRPGFDVGQEAEQGMPSASELVNPTGNQVNANDERFALAA